jgi:SAM-dependent methyltransferase
VEPSLFYTGLVADLYAPLRSQAPDPEPYAQFIGRSGQPALELGCGDGDPLLDLRSRGLDVDGLDSSADMLDRCRRAALDRSIDVVLHHQPMQSMDLPRRYRSIYLAGPTFNLLADDAEAVETLTRIGVHLEASGSALVPLFIPAPTPERWFGKPRESIAADGATLRFSAISEIRDEAARTQTTMCRYERISADESSVLDRPWLLHWYTQGGFRDLVAAAGLSVTAVLDNGGLPATPDAQDFVFLLSGKN